MTKVPVPAALRYPGRLVAVPTLLTPRGPVGLSWQGASLWVTASASGEPPTVSAGGGRPLETELAEHGEPGLAERTALVAVGSNGSAAVLDRKLTGAGVSSWVPMLPGRIAGIAVGHSAHISRGGYIAAAPYAAPGAVTPVVVGWFTASQLAALDRTEPNYRRVDLAHRHYPLVTGEVVLAPAYQIYESRHGVIALADTVIPLGTQAELHAIVATEPHLAAVAPWRDAQALGLALTTDEVRARFVRVVAEHGYARASGLRRAEPAG